MIFIHISVATYVSYKRWSCHAA